MEDLVTTLMTTLHPPLSHRIAVGTEVKTKRGYGVVAAMWPRERWNGDANQHDGYTIVVELDDGARTVFEVDELQVVER